MPQKRGKSWRPGAASPDWDKLDAEAARLRAELSAARRRIADLERRVDEDPLLPLLNRRGFMRELERALAFAHRYGTKAALLFMDLDGFKAINDTHGHAAGDDILRSVAATLLDNLRRSDLVGRLGGDEFAVLLWAAEPVAAQRKARQLAAAIEAAHHPRRGEGGALSVSCGVAVIASGDSAESALERADSAMYAEKRAKGMARGS